MRGSWPPIWQRFKRATSYVTVIIVYGITVVSLAIIATLPARVAAHDRIVSILTRHANSSIGASVQIPLILISGRPVRIVIPDSHIDLPIDPGYYDSNTNSWTLNGYRAQFAISSAPANNIHGDTFIYGHNNNYVFGPLRHRTPATAAIALLYTDNGHIFSYRFVSSSSYQPNDTSIFTYDGPSRLTIQTCTGSLNEWRTMYEFTFQGVQD